MLWTAPAVERVDEPFVADERAMLEGFLDFGRSTLLLKYDRHIGHADLLRERIDGTTGT